MRRVFALAGVLLFCTQGAVAQNVAAPGPAAKAVERVMTLGNGMKVVVAEKHLAPIVETDVFYHFGSGDETAGKTGLAHALEHMMFRGTKEISYAGLNELYAHFGARINGRTNEDFTQFYEIAPSAALGTILRVEADRMQHLALLAKDWNTERGAVLSEIDGDLANPLGRFTIAVRRAIFQGSGYELPAFGVRADVARATVDDLRKYYSEWYAPNNATLVVVGDVRTEDVFALAKAAFGGIASRRVPEHLAVVPVKSSAPQRVVQSAEFPFEIVDLAYPTPAGNTSAIYDLQNFSVVLGDERSAFFRDIVQAGTALAIFPNLEFHDRGGVFHVIMVLSPGKGVDAARAAFEGTLAKYVADGIPADLVNEARTRLVAQNLFEQDSLSSFAFELGHLYGVAGITFARDTELTAAVTPASVVAAAKRYMSVPYVIGDLKPSGSKIEGIAPPTSASGVSDNFGARSPEGELVLPQYAREAMAQRFVGRSSVDPTRFKVGGIDVLVQPVKDASTVLMRGDLRSSPVMDPVGREGLYDIATGLMSYGGEKVPFETMQAKLGSLGAELRVGSSIRGRMLSKDFETVIGLMAESLREPAFPQKYLDVAMRQERDSIGRLDTLPDYQARRTTLELLLPKNDPELRRPSLESLANISRADLVSEARKYVRPDYLSLAFVGDVTPERVRRALETSFAGWQGEGPVVDTNLPPIPDPKAAAKLIPSHEKVVHVSVTMRAPARGDADYDALWIAAMLLGGASDSRLMGELRGKLGLVYNISAKVDSGIDRGTVAFEFTAAPQNVRKALTVLKSEVRRISEETPRASELFGVRRAVIARAFVNQQSFAEVGDDILKIATDGLPRDYYATLDQRFGNIAPAQVKAAARRYLSPDHWIEVYSGPSGW